MEFLAEIGSFLKTCWLSVRGEPWFAPAKGVFFGSLGTQIVSEYQSGHLDFSLAGWEHMAAAALVATIISLEGLYTPAPGTTPRKD